jgi:hypothetical protein
MLYCGVESTKYFVIAVVSSHSGFGVLVVSMLASGTQDRGFAPGRSRKNPKHAFLRKGNKEVCPMSQICGMSKNLIIYCGIHKL